MTKLTITDRVKLMESGKVVGEGIITKVAHTAVISVTTDYNREQPVEPVKGKGKSKAVATVNTDSVQHVSAYSDGAEGLFWFTYDGREKILTVENSVITVYRN